MQRAIYIGDVSIHALRAKLRSSREQDEADVGDDPMRALRGGCAEGEEAESSEDRCGQQEFDAEFCFGGLGRDGGFFAFVHHVSGECEGLSADGEADAERDVI